MIDPGTAYIGGKLLEGVGGLLKKDWSKQELAEKAREFNLSQQYQEEQGRSQTQFDQAGHINDLQRQMQLAPLRDKVSYMLNQRAGMTPQAFNPRDMANPYTSGATNPQQGGIDPQALQGAMQHYQAPNFMTDQAGSGGVDPRMYHQLMARLGVNGPYGAQSIGDVPIEQSSYSNPFASPPQTPGTPNPNGQGTNPQAPNGIKVNPPGTTPWGSQMPSWGGGGMPGSQAPLPPQASPQMDMTRRTRRY